MSATAPPALRPVLTGLGVLSAFGRGPAPLTAAAGHGRDAFAEVTRFDFGARRTRRAARLTG
ncbi:beta-ketoacyl-[acyl-carrier-protein] synthase family protein, partial [Kitasatospora sp. NPDC054939]